MSNPHTARILNAPPNYVMWLTVIGFAGLVFVPACSPTREPSGYYSPTANYQAGERYDHLEPNPFVATEEDNLTTFSVDGDTASYTIMRRDLHSGNLPFKDSVRVEEYVNFFNFEDEAPLSTDAPFTINVEAAPSYFGDGLHLLRVGIRGMEVPAEQRPATNLVFLVDVSGSMNSPDKLGLVQFALSTLVNSLRPEDTIGIVLYAGSSGVLLRPTPISERGRILEAIEGLTAGGSTNGEAGLRSAYELAEQNFQPDGINRVLLCTDGDFNVGVTGDALIDMIERYRDRGVTLTTLGFGRGNYNDRDMEQLADRGNGNYAYIDGRNEALRVLQRDLSGTLQVIAADVKVQVEFNADQVSRFRLVGYENRVLAHEDFVDDSVDAAEIGSGQFTTAFIEFELAEGVNANTAAGVLAEIRIRYKAPGSNESREIVEHLNLTDLQSTFEEASPVFRFGAAVAEFAEILRQSEHSLGARFDDVHSVASDAIWSDSGDVQEFLTLVQTASQLWER